MTRAAATPERLTRQIHWARSEADRLRRIAGRNQADVRKARHARRMAGLAEATAATLTELAARAAHAPSTAAHPNRLKLWMAEPDAAVLAQELTR